MAKYAIVQGFYEQGSDPATPASGLWELYCKSGGIYLRNSAGTVLGPLGTGGGTGGNVSTLPSGNITIGSLALADRPPTSPGTYDEEFEGTADTLPTNWAWTSTPGTWFLNSRWPSLLTVELADGVNYILTRTSFTAAATFGLWAKVHVGPFTGADTASLRLYVSNSGGTEKRGVNFRGTAARASGVRGLRIIASAESVWGTELTGLVANGGSLYIGMTRDGSNNFTGWYSMDGIAWDVLAAAQAHTITIDRFSLGFQMASAQSLVGIDWVRYRTDNAFPRP